MKNGLIRILAILMLGALWVVHSGCASSPPSRFYLLSSLDTPRPEMKPSADERCFSVGIGPVKIPEYLDQPKIVTRGGSNELKLAEFDRWSEGFKGNMTRVLAKNLSNCFVPRPSRSFHGEGGSPSIIGLNWMSNASTVSRGRCLSGGLVEAPERGREKDASQSKRTSFSEAAGGGDYELSRLRPEPDLGNLSREVAEAIKTLPK